MAIGNLFGSGGESNSLYGTSLTSGGSIPAASSFIYFEWFIFKVSASQPATPTGGSWDFLTNTGTAPTGWVSNYSGIPLDNMWFSIAFVDSRNPTGFTWSTPGLISATTSVYASAYADKFTGNGSTTAWTLSADPVTVQNLDVSVNGVTQTPTTDYTISGTTFTTTTAAPLGSIILVKYRQALPNSYYGLASNVGYTPHNWIASTNVQTALNEVADDIAAVDGVSGSNLVGYKPAGTGAVATTVQAKLRQTVSVMDFGAKGDGTTDDTAAIQAAINAATASAAAVTGTLIVEFPAGVYKVTSTLTITTYFIRLQGIGQPIIKIFHNNDVISCTGIPNTSVNPRNKMIFDSLVFNTNTGNSPLSVIRFGTNSGSTPTYINSVNDAEISNCVFDQITATYVIDNNRGYGLVIRDCQFTSLVVTAALKMRQSTSEIPYWTYAVSIYGTDFTSITGTAIQADGGDLTVFGSIIEGCSVGGVRLGMNNAFTGAQPVSFYGVYFETNTTFHVLAENGLDTINFTGCKFVGTSALTFASASQTVFTNCSSPNNTPTISGGNIKFNGCNYMQGSVGTVDSFTTDRNIQYTDTPTTPVVFSGNSGYGPRIYANSPGAGGGGILLMCSHSGYPAAANSVTELFLIATTLSGTTVSAISLGRSTAYSDTATFSFAVDASGYLSVTASQAGSANYNFISQSKYPTFAVG